MYNQIEFNLQFPYVLSGLLKERMSIFHVTSPRRRQAIIQSWYFGSKIQLAFRCTGKRTDLTIGNRQRKEEQSNWQKANTMQNELMVMSTTHRRATQIDAISDKTDHSDDGFSTTCKRKTNKHDDTILSNCESLCLNQCEQRHRTNRANEWANEQTRRNKSFAVFIDTNGNKCIRIYEKLLCTFSVSFCGFLNELNTKTATTTFAFRNEIIFDFDFGYFSLRVHEISISSSKTSKLTISFRLSIYGMRKFARIRIRIHSETSSSSFRLTESFALILPLMSFIVDSNGGIVVTVAVI